MPVKKNLADRFSKILLRWYKEDNARQMPWKGEKDPYRVWLSEVILQQTRVEQGLKYYESFIKAFPTIEVLARAPDQQIYKLWEGLGYYTRCRNLIDTARHVVTELKGKFPNRYEKIKKLKGIGPYTASAIASFAFNEPTAVVDGNVFRVLSRVFGIKTPIDSAEGKKHFNLLANELIDKRRPAIFNQAIMDFGAVVCKPVPQCEQCPFNTLCTAFLQGKIGALPVKQKKTAIRKRWFNYVVLEYGTKVAIRQRTERDIWHNLFEFLLVESVPAFTTTDILTQMRKKGWFLKKDGFQVTSVSPVFRQQLSHQRIEGKFINVRVQHKLARMKDVLWIRKAELKNYAFPKFINLYLQHADG